jgi:hypothetical protein
MYNKKNELKRDCPGLGAIQIVVFELPPIPDSFFSFLIMRRMGNKICYIAFI